MQAFFVHHGALKLNLYNFFYIFCIFAFWLYFLQRRKIQRICWHVAIFYICMYRKWKYFLNVCRNWRIKLKIKVVLSFENSTGSGAETLVERIAHFRFPEPRRATSTGLAGPPGRVTPGSPFCSSIRPSSTSTRSSVSLSTGTLLGGNPLTFW